METRPRPNDKSSTAGIIWERAEHLDLDLVFFEFQLERRLAIFENQFDREFTFEFFGHTPRVRANAASAKLESALVDLFAGGIKNAESETLWLVAGFSLCRHHDLTAIGRRHCQGETEIALPIQR